MVYGDLVVPGVFFPDAHSSDNLDRFRRIDGKFAPCKQTYKPPKHRYVPRDLHATLNVFLRTNTNKPCLTLPYYGPYKVIEKKEKAFLLRIKGGNDWIAIDCLKPAYFQDDDPPPVQFSRMDRPLSHVPKHFC
ncbi:uncharacterized protein LOC123498127 [Portunus trituberculatus]|uniref:uncharacterized protein LOC123498127 n=1 Tax=Portunus trituberculatus TaxID=210409 RepID=UPI001E1CB0F0|nr:uncharacterized protein LOC123498127 [Portunus trituberculatus]